MKFNDQKQFNIGETWVSRDNRKYTIIDIDGDPSFPIKALDSKRRFFKFSRTGTFLESGFSHENDLVERLYAM